MIDSYDTMLKRSYGYDENYQSGSSEWDLVRHLYDCNYLNAEDKRDRIPKKIHQIWLGSKLPIQFKKYVDSWKKFHPEWEYKLWGDKDVKDIDLVQGDKFHQATNMGMKSDILRYEILNQFGGIYADTDFECLRSFNDLMYLNFFTSLSYDLEMQLYIGLIACMPDHPIIKRCLTNMTTLYKGDSSAVIMNDTGSYHFTRCFLSLVDKKTRGTVAFPMDFFYPLPNTERGTMIPYFYTKSFSYAIHHWAVAWIRSNKKKDAHTGR